MIHGVVTTSPGRILVSMNKTNTTETLQKLEKLFTQFGMMDPKVLENITGYQDRPRRPGDPTLVNPQAQAYIHTLKNPTGALAHQAATKMDSNVWARPPLAIYQAPAPDQSLPRTLQSQDTTSHDDPLRAHEDMEVKTLNVYDDMEDKTVNAETTVEIVYDENDDDQIVATTPQAETPSSLALVHSMNLLLKRLETKAYELEFEVAQNTDTMTHAVGHVYDVEKVVQQRVTDVGHNLHQLFIENQEAALKVQLGTGDLSTKQDMYKTEGTQ